MKANRVLLVVIAACAIGALLLAFAQEGSVAPHMTSKTVQLRTEGEFPSLGGATGWLNSPPLTAAALHGKVVLIEAAHGIDVDDQGNGRVTEPRMYQLIRQQAPITDRQFEVEFLDPGAQGFSFTFG